MTTNGGGVQRSGTGHMMVQYASYLLWAVFIIFEIIAEEYFVANVGLVVAAGVVVLPRLAAQATEAIAPLPAFAKVGGYLIAFAGVIEILDDIRFDAYDGFVSVLGALLAYAAYILAFVGARSIDA